MLPQAFRAVIAPLGSVLIALIKNTTIALAVGVSRGRRCVMREMIETTATR